MKLLRKAKEIMSPEPKWPDTTPPDKTHAFWEINNNLNLNGVPYHKVEVEPGKWQWQVDKEVQQASWDHETRKRQLATDMQTRILTEEEMQEAIQHGIHLFTYNMQSYSCEEKQKEFNEAICQQYRLRAIVNKTE